MKVCDICGKEVIPWPPWDGSGLHEKYECFLHYFKVNDACRRCLRSLDRAFMGGKLKSFVMESIEANNKEAEEQWRF